MAGLDTRIPLQVGQGVEPIKSPLETYSKILGVKNQQQELQQRQDSHKESLQIQEENFKRLQQSNAKAAQEAKDADIVRTAYVQANGHPDQTVDAAIKGGAGPEAVQKLQTHFGELAKSAAAADKDKLAVDEAKNNQFLGIHDQYLALPENIRAQAWPGIYQQIAKLDPEAAKRLDPNAPPSTEDALISRALHFSQEYTLKSEAEKRAKAEEARKAALAVPQLTEAQNKAITSTPDPITGLTKEQAAQSADRSADNARADAAAKALEADRKAQRALDLKRLGIDQSRLALAQREYQDKTTGSAATLSPERRSIAEKIANGDMNPTLVSRYPDKEAIMAAALDINPDWSSNTYATKKAFTDPSSLQSKNLGTVSRIAAHIGQFEKNSGELGLSPSLLTGVNITGTAAKTAEDAHAIASELEKLVSGGVGTVGQVKAWQEALLSSRAGIRQAAIDEISQLIGGQFEGMNQSYKAGTGKDLPLDQFASPEAKKWLASKGINVTGASSGRSTPTITDEAGYNKLKSGDKFIWNGKEGTKP